MPGVPWTKFQDFYLRLGFLKVLVATLSPHRRSAANDSIYKKLETPLFRPLDAYPGLHKEVSGCIDLSYKRMAKGRPYLLEALVIKACPSWLFAITSDTIYKILDWGHDVQFVGRGNQITERALILRAIMPNAAFEFLLGDVRAWNPFQLTLLERLFFLYHLIEIDRVTLVLIESLTAGNDVVLESTDAGKLTCRAMFRVLEEAQHDLSPSQLPRYRIAYELAKVIAEELGMAEYAPKSDRGFPVRRVPRPPRVIKRSFSGIQAATKRKPNKNSDHQTIPRFEQLVDLGFVAKPQNVDASNSAPQRRWRYVRTDLGQKWVAAKRKTEQTGRNWLWHGFARTAVESFVTPSEQQFQIPYRDTVDVFADAYEAVKRPVGHTPFDTVALRAMLEAASRGRAIELSDFHKLMLQVKTRNLLPEHAFFAAGNEIDKMFINLRPGFREKLLEVGVILGEGSMA